MLNSRWERANLDQDIDENISTNEICSWFDTDRHTKYYCVVCAVGTTIPTKP